jgi:deltex-like protein
MWCVQRDMYVQVGTSVTNGTENTVVWAGIHHKTATSGGAFAYPDPKYLSRVTEELASVGVK